MTPEERQLIGDLFDRMRSTGLQEKDREAESFINQSMRGTQDSAYKLVQSVLIQENALQEAGYRIEDLEARVHELEDQIAQMQPQQQQPQRQSGGFLGGLFGSKPSAPSSVPQTGQRYEREQQPMGSPWGQQSPRGGYAPQQGGYAQPQGGYQQQQPQPQQPQRSGGGFMKTAAMTAAGVAGGMLAAGAIRDMLGGGAHAGQRGSSDSQEAHSPYEVTPNQPYDQAAADAAQDAADDAAYEDNSGWDSGDSDSGSDNDV